MKPRLNLRLDSLNLHRVDLLRTLFMDQFQDNLTQMKMLTLTSEELFEYDERNRDLISNLYNIDRHLETPFVVDTRNITIQTENPPQT